VLAREPKQLLVVRALQMVATWTVDRPHSKALPS
jgi:hypothetical protein